MLTMAPFYQVSQNATSVSKNAQKQSHGPGSDKLNAAIQKVIKSIWALPASTSQNVGREKGQ